MSQSFTAKALTAVGLILIAAGFVLGIVLGNQETPFDALNQYRTGFHWQIMLLWWLGGATAGMVLLGLAEIVHYLSVIAFNTQPAVVLEEGGTDPRVAANSKASLEAAKDYKMRKLEE
ncbi:hypothetical protein J31TS4_03080 [Paenibacillus sp. J31TS4]|uniref:hypothetical protein n=1 Tax=Paenibacillus sp. J31TS4 TaxID=2807195 RepID=UPI001B1F1D15|nr:hypothetical protein [Paenibacillus sp. J31TS4]GIP37028.1 hypothetical protein J31TS4_03080 [Paenibacillus sp. J31TS4]